VVRIVDAGGDDLQEKLAEYARSIKEAIAVKA